MIDALQRMANDPLRRRNPALYKQVGDIQNKYRRPRDPRLSAQNPDREKALGGNPGDTFTPMPIAPPMQQPQPSIEQREMDMLLGTNPVLGKGVPADILGQIKQKMLRGAPGAPPMGQPFQPMPYFPPGMPGGTPGMRPPMGFQPPTGNPNPNPFMARSPGSIGGFAGNPVMRGMDQNVLGRFNPLV